MNEKSIFAVFEGIDGSGKTTQARLLEKRLTGMCRAVYLTAEPTGGKTGVRLREALSGRVPTTDCELATMFLLDRINHNRLIEEKLSAGYDVICDRYYYSSMAYQGGVTDPEWVASMNLRCPGIRRPDICLFLDLTPEQSMERITKGRDSLEIFETAEKLSCIRRSFDTVFERYCAGEKICRIDASGNRDDVADEVYEAVKSCFNK